MRRLFLLVFSFYFLVSSPLAAQELVLSDSAFASVITCGVGNEYYLSWGHSAIRVCDPTMGIDYAYNYGTFDFDTPHFYWKFACGDLNYCLSRTRFSHFLSEYVYEERAVWEQRLRLTPQEVKNLFVLLETNYMPEYRYYKYDFFRDNCATRVRDMIASCLVHRTLSPETTLAPRGRRPQFTHSPKSYRDYLYEPTERTKLWWRLGVDITLGMRCDHPCTNYETMFSPIKMMETFDTMTVSDTKQPIVEPAVQLLEDNQEPLAASIPPTLVFWVFFGVMAGLTCMSIMKGWRLTAVDRILYITAALISLLIIFLWFFTSHYCTKYNLNILWASPLFIYFAIRPLSPFPFSFFNWVAWIQVVMLLAAVFFCIFPHPQRLNAAIAPIALTLAMRLIANLSTYKHINK